MSSSDLVYKIALGTLPGIGDINARKLVDYFGDIEAIFRESYHNLTRIPGIGSKLARSITESNSLDLAKKEIEFINKFGINTSFYLDEDYPARLKECPDSPVLIYFKGDLKSNSTKIISIIGTRNATRRGKDICSTIIKSLSNRYPDLVIVSGLAYGIDICAHKSALKCNISTIGVLAHGFETLYPSTHTVVAREMLKKGGLVTDFLSHEPPDRNNFLKRNRIIAGMSDAILVIESGVKGGAMVTADIAQSYNRDVLAVPGFPNNKYSSGCNLLIKSQKASLVESESDIEYLLNWSPGNLTEAHQQKLLPELSPLEDELYTILKSETKLSADQLSTKTGKPIQQLSSALLSLEFSGLITTIPGNIYIYNQI